MLTFAALVAIFCDLGVGQSGFRGLRNHHTARAYCDIAPARQYPQCWVSHPTVAGGLTQIILYVSYLVSLLPRDAPGLGYKVCEEYPEGLGTCCLEARLPDLTGLGAHRLLASRPSIGLVEAGSSGG
jgi:hypothetical protein